MRILKFVIAGLLIAGLGAAVAAAVNQQSQGSSRSAAAATTTTGAVTTTKDSTEADDEQAADDEQGEQAADDEQGEQEAKDEKVEKNDESATERGDAEQDEAKGDEKQDEAKSDDKDDVDVKVTGILTKTPKGYAVGARKVSFGPPWYASQSSLVQQRLGKSVTVIGKADDEDDGLSVRAIDGAVYRAQGKPPWAGKRGHHKTKPCKKEDCD